MAEMNEDDERIEEQWPPAAEVRAIESLEDYLRRYGLRQLGDDEEHENGNENENDDRERGGDGGTNRRSEAPERVRAGSFERARRRSCSSIPLHGDDEDDDRGAQGGAGGDDGGGVITVVLSDGTARTVPLGPLFVSCDTVRRMVFSRLRFGRRFVDGGDDSGEGGAESGGDVRMKDDPSPPPPGHRPSLNDDGGGGEGPIPSGAIVMELSLVEFHPGAVSEFLAAISFLYGADEGDVGVDDATVEAVVDKKLISEEHVVDCLRVSHFLQCRALTDGLSVFVGSSVDSSNCMAVCSLADALCLPALFEASVNHVIDRLDALQSEGAEDVGGKRARAADGGAGEGEGEGEREAWNSLPPHLRCRVLTMRNVLRSSVVGRGSNASGIFFSCGDEFLAIFREAIRDQRERLSEARERSDEVVRERSEEWFERKRRRGVAPWFNVAKECAAEKEFVYGGSVRYAMDKIEKQERRLRTLQSFYEEQKEIFRSGELVEGGGGGDAELKL